MEASETPAAPEPAEPTPAAPPAPEPAEAPAEGGGGTITGDPGFSEENTPKD